MTSISALLSLAPGARAAARARAVLGYRPRRGVTAPSRCPSKAQQAFQRGLTVLAPWVEREGADQPEVRGRSAEITVGGEAEPVVVRLGVWVSHTKTRGDKLTAEQRDALRGL
ncbi:hypothetical protein [Streptomyces platensis]|uniref:hypothetical protein n=1 Tax=Streptomyces platensis TaxID=58346 RepID=UPI003F4CB676